MERIQRRQELYDGLEDTLYDRVFLVYDYAFPVWEMIRGNFMDLRQRLPESEFRQLIADSGFKSSEDTEFAKSFKKSSPDFPMNAHYVSPNDQTLHWKILNDDLLFLFSFGEVQPARYRLFSEGVWRISPSHQFRGNMGEPDTVESFVNLYGVDPRMGQLPINSLKQLHDTLIVKGYTGFYIAAEGMGGPADNATEILDFVNDRWIVAHSGLDGKREPLFMTPDKEEAIVFFYKHVVSTTKQDQVPPQYPIVISPYPQEETPEPKTGRMETTETETQSEPIDETTFVPFHDDDYFPEIKSHNPTLFNKQSIRLIKLTVVCGAIALVLHVFHADGISSLFLFFFIILLLWVMVFRFRQDTRKPSFKVTKDGVFLNQQFLRNAFVPWSNVAKVELRGFTDTPAIVITFANVKTLLKDQFFVLRSMAKAQLKPNPTIAISHFETECDLNRTYEIIGQYLPEAKIKSKKIPKNREVNSPSLKPQLNDTPLQKTEPNVIYYDYEANNQTLTRESTYTRLEDNMTKAYYRQIVSEALQQAEEEYRIAPNSAPCASFFNQLTDIKKTVIEQGVVYTESEASKRYSLGIMAVRNFDGYPDDWDYPKKLSDINWGISRYHEMFESNRLDFDKECDSIATVFAAFFTQHGFTLKAKSSGTFALIYENTYAEMIFDFDSYGSRFGLSAPATVVYRRPSNGRCYDISEMTKQLGKVDYKTVFKEYFEVRHLGYFESQREIITRYLNDAIADAGFSWLQRYKDDYEYYNPEEKYIPLSKHRTKKRYRQILAMAIDETEVAIQRSPEMKMYQVILEQLRDLKQNIIIIHVKFTEDEIFSRYNFGAIAVKNFDLEEDEYAQKLSDVFAGSIDYNEMPEE